MQVAPAAGLVTKHRLYTAPYLAHKLIKHIPLDDTRHPLRRQFQTSTLFILPYKLYGVKYIDPVTLVIFPGSSRQTFTASPQTRYLM